MLRGVNPVEQRAKATFFVAFLLTMLGTCGVSRGAAGLMAGHPPEPPLDSIPKDAADAQALAQVLAQWQKVLYRDRARRPLAAANVVVSVLLIVASGALTLRRSSALWWVRQAIVANSLWILISGGAAVAAVVRARATFAGALETQVGHLILVQTFGSILNLALHLVVDWRARRPDIRAFLDEEVAG